MSKTNPLESTIEKMYADAAKRGNVRKIVRFGNMITDPNLPFKKHGSRVKIGQYVYKIESIVEHVIEYEESKSDKQE